MRYRRTTCSAWSRLERDRDGRPHQIRVQVGRQNVQVRARRQVQYARLTPNTWSRDVVMGARAAIAGRQHRAADAAVDLHVPRCAPRTR